MFTMEWEHVLKRNTYVKAWGAGGGSFLFDISACFISTLSAIHKKKEGCNCTSQQDCMTGLCLRKWRGSCAESSFCQKEDDKPG